MGISVKTGWYKVGRKLAKSLRKCWQKPLAQHHPKIGPTSPQRWTKGWADIAPTSAQRRRCWANGQNDVGPTSARPYHVIGAGGTSTKCRGLWSWAINACARPSLLCSQSLSRTSDAGFYHILKIPLQSEGWLNISRSQKEYTRRPGKDKKKYIRWCYASHGLNINLYWQVQQVVLWSKIHMYRNPGVVWLYHSPPKDCEV